MTALTQEAANSVVGDPTMQANEYLTMLVGDQMFGIPVLLVQDILQRQKLTHVPMAKKEVAGVLNLRGRVITGIDVRVRLGLADRPDKSKFMSIVVDHDGELYSLNVDSVGEVLNLSSHGFEENLSSLSPTWRSFSKGIFRLEGRLLVVLDVAELLGGHD